MPNSGLPRGAEAWAKASGGGACGKGLHQQARKKRSRAAWDIETDPVERAPRFLHEEAGHCLDFGVAGAARLVEPPDVGGGELLHRVQELYRGEAAAREGSAARVMVINFIEADRHAVTE